MNTENIFLVKRAQRRDKDAFCELMDLQMKDMYRVAIAILASEEDAGDAMQDTILSCWEKIDTLKKPQYFKTWLTRIADNKVTDYFRSRQYHESIVTQIMDDTLPEVADERAGTETSVLDKLSYEEMEKMYGHHKNCEWETFRLKVYEGYTFGEISASQGVELSTVKSRYYSMLKRVRKEWDYLE